MPHLRGFAGAGLADDDDHLVLADDLEQLLAALVHGQQLALVLDRVLLRELADLRVSSLKLPSDFFALAHSCRYAA